jgi:serine/threonine protein kinase
LQFTLKVNKSVNFVLCDVQSFRREADLYASSIFKKLMPATLAVVDNADGSERLGRYVFPPCIVIKKGQSLNEFASSNVADFITIFQTLLHVVRAVKVMHEMGFAHRDIKPGNILRRPGEHDWTLIDFGCAVRIGAYPCGHSCHSRRAANPGGLPLFFYSHARAHEGICTVGCLGNSDA